MATLILIGSTGYTSATLGNPFPGAAATAEATALERSREVTRDSKHRPLALGAPFLLSEGEHQSHTNAGSKQHFL